MNLQQQSPLAWKDFEKWFKYYAKENRLFGQPFHKFETGQCFEMQLGVYMKYLEENQIYTSSELEVQYTREIDEDGKNPHYVPEGWYCRINDDSYPLYTSEIHKTSDEAYKEAIEQAFKIRNKQLTIIESVE